MPLMSLPQGHRAQPRDLQEGESMVPRPGCCARTRRCQHFSRAASRDPLQSSAPPSGHVSAVVQLAHALGLRVVAEGVETNGQRDILLGLGCDELQGFFFARPMTADTLVHWTQGLKPAGAADFSPSVMHAEL